MAEALGMIECRSFAAVVEAADAMVKAARVELVQYEKVIQEKVEMEQLMVTVYLVVMDLQEDQVEVLVEV